MTGNELSFLDGRVLKRSLPVFAPPLPPSSPVLKRLKLSQGELDHFWNGEEPIRYIASLELRAGTARGNHYHLHKREWIYVIKGQITVLVEDPASRRHDDFVLRTGDLGVIDIGIAHVYRITSSGQAVEFSSVTFDAADVYPWDFQGSGG